MPSQVPSRDRPRERQLLFDFDRDLAAPLPPVVHTQASNTDAAKSPEASKAGESLCSKMIGFVGSKLHQLETGLHLQLRTKMRQNGAPRGFDLDALLAEGADSLYRLKGAATRAEATARQGGAGPDSWDRQTPKEIVATIEQLDELRRLRSKLVSGTKEGLVDFLRELLSNRLFSVVCAKESEWGPHVCPEWRADLYKHEELKSCHALIEHLSLPPLWAYDQISTNGLGILARYSQAYEGDKFADFCARRGRLLNSVTDRLNQVIIP